jgi:hypothetical protein
VMSMDVALSCRCVSVATVGVRSHTYKQQTR